MSRAEAAQLEISRLRTKDAQRQHLDDTHNSHEVLVAQRNFSLVLRAMYFSLSLSQHPKSRANPGLSSITHLIRWMRT